eukprot:6491907-Amphidinium_carterae.1
MLRQRWAILPAEDLPLWLPERIQTKLARSEDSTTRPFLCLLCGLGMGQPSKRKSFQSIDSLWAHFFARHMDTTNVQHLVEKLVAEWSHLETADREAAMGWARDAGRSHGFDVREVLGSTGIPGQNGWKERPRLPRDWPPPQLAKGKDKGKAGTDLKEAEVVRRPYPFGPMARQQREEMQRRDERSEKQAKNPVENKAGRSARDEKRGRSETRQDAPRVDKRAREDQSDQSEDSAPELRDERRGKHEQSARRAERLPSDPRGGRDAPPTAGNRRTFRLIPAQDVKKEDKGAKGDSRNKRRDRTEERGAKTTFSLKEKKQRGTEGDTERRGGRYSPSQSECSRTEVATGKRGRQRSLRKEIRRAVESSPSSSLGRLLQEVASSSDECIERKVTEAKRISKARVQGRRRVGKVAAELQVLALAVESKEA